MEKTEQVYSGIRFQVSVNNIKSRGEMEMKDAREARRRKLLSCGSDRLAFITGQSRSLSEPDPPSPPPSAGSTVFAKFIEPPETGTASTEGLTEEPTGRLGFRSTI